MGSESHLREKRQREVSADKGPGLERDRLKNHAEQKGPRAGGQHTSQGQCGPGPERLLR